MKHGGGGWKLPTEDEVEVVEVLLNLPKLWQKSELVSRYSFTWGRKKKRSVLESPPVPSAQPEKSPSTPLCFLPSGSGGSHGGDNRKPPLSGPKVLKRKATDDLMEVFNTMLQEKENLMKQLKAMETLHQELTYENLELKAKGQQINYPRNMEDYHIWNNSMETSDQQRCHQQIVMFAPATPQMAVDPNNGKAVAVSCSANNNGGFGMFNQINPRVKIHEEPYDFMGLSQPLDQSKYLMMDNDLRVRTAADARKRRILRMKQNKKSLLAMKPSRLSR